MKAVLRFLDAAADLALYVLAAIGTAALTTPDDDHADFEQWEQEVRR